MKKFGVVENVPDWAACYLMYGDESGITAADKIEIIGFLDGLRREGLRIVAPVDGTHNEFCTRPAFGGACAVDDWTTEEIEG